MTTPKPNQRRQTNPPTAGSRPSIRVDDALAADLADLMRTGSNFTDAVRQAVGQLASMYRTAWQHGVCPEGTAPKLLAYQLEQQPTASHAPTGRYDTLSDAARHPRPTGRPLPDPPVGRHLTA